MDGTTLLTLTETVMKKRLLIPLMFLVATQAALAEKFSITSPQLKAGGLMAEQQVYNDFGCKGGNVSPSLSWKGAPAGTKSFAVTVYDPDAPTGSGWWHWVIFNIPAAVTTLETNAGNVTANLAPVGSVQSMTDFGKPGYGGPCPPAGDKPHRYQFTVYALKIDKLPLDANAPGAMVGFYLNQNLIKKTSLQAKYKR